jgi:hypothetical protein
LSIRYTLKITAAVWGIYKDYWSWGSSQGFYDYYQDSQNWVQSGIIDAICPMIYWPMYDGTPPYFDYLVDDFVANNGGRHVYAGMSGDYSDFNEIATEIDYSRNAGAQGNVLFAYSYLVSRAYWDDYLAGPYSIAVQPPAMPWKNATPTPTPTPSIPPDTGILRGQITFERPGIAPPDSSWIVPVTIGICSGGGIVGTYSATADETGYFSVEMPFGIHELQIKNNHSLAVVRSGVYVPPGGSSAVIDFGVLPEGDATDDNNVVSSDFFILKASYNLGQGDTGYDDRADFNEDTMVTSTDFFLLKSHYNQSGEECLSE